ncbi:serine protease [Mesorhizobium sp.]|uniref:S1 family peptidase n=1 Tax=Mesorhizobium sp. TaxID=1871066 RepID=UPI0025D7AEA1|nr:serine protease [Mesorhizobium sp.]
MTAQIDRFSLVTAPLSMYFDGTHLSDATGFIWEQGPQNYLITNWHVVTGRNALDGRSLHGHGGRPNVVRALFNTRVQQFLKQEHVIRIRDDDGRPLWLTHPSRGRAVDVVAIPLPYDDDNAIFELHPINRYAATELTARIANEVFVLGYPFGPEPPGYPVWKRGSMASEPDLAAIGTGYYLVDTASRPGMSGSPVIRRIWNQRVDGDKVIPSPTPLRTEFVGVYSGRRHTKNESDAQLGLVWPRHCIEDIIIGAKRDED